MKKFIFIEYPKCSTCQKAKKFLENHAVDFEDRHIVEKKPTVSELKKWILISQKPVKSFFNTSGLVYKNQNIKEKLPLLSEEEQIELLSQDGMLIKRPLLVSDTSVLVGFKSEEWKNLIDKK